MQRICFVLQVKPERLTEYKERHRSVWPEMQDALRETGWHNYSLSAPVRQWLCGKSILVGSAKWPDSSCNARICRRIRPWFLWKRSFMFERGARAACFRIPL